MVEQSLNIAVIQTDLVWENAEANLERFGAKIASIEKPVDVILLPEMFATGFSMQPEKMAAEMNGPELTWMKKWAKEKNAALCGSLAIKENNKFYNRLFWVNPTGEVFSYNKRHLFSLSDEPKIYTAGNERLIVEYKGWKICPLICYDLRFPVWARNTDAYDLLIYSANWPERRIHAWQSLLIARAIENQTYVVGVNRIGNDAHDISHTGDSMIIDPLGMVLQHAESTDTILYASLKKSELEKIRTSLPFLNDADSFSIEL